MNDFNDAGLSTETDQSPADDGTSSKTTPINVAVGNHDSSSDAAPTTNDACSAQNDVTSADI